MARGLGWSCKHRAFLLDPVGHFFVIGNTVIKEYGKGSGMFI